MNRQFIYEFYVNYDFLTGKTEKKLVQHKILTETRDRIVLLDGNFEELEAVIVINNNRTDSRQSEYIDTLEVAKGGHIKITSLDEVWGLMYSSSKSNARAKYKEVQNKINSIISEKYGKYKEITF